MSIHSIRFTITRFVSKNTEHYNWTYINTIIYYNWTLYMCQQCLGSILGNLNIDWRYSQAWSYICINRSGDLPGEIVHLLNWLKLVDSLSVYECPNLFIWSCVADVYIFGSPTTLCCSSQRTTGTGPMKRGHVVP